MVAEGDAFHVTRVLDGTVVDLAKPAIASQLALSETGTRMLMHPRGEHLLVVTRGMLTVVELHSSRALGPIWIPEPPGPNRDVIEHFSSHGYHNRLLEMLDGTLPEGHGVPVAGR